MYNQFLLPSVPDPNAQYSCLSLILAFGNFYCLLFQFAETHTCQPFTIKKQEDSLKKMDDLIKSIFYSNSVIKKYYFLNSNIILQNNVLFYSNYLIIGLKKHKPQII